MMGEGQWRSNWGVDSIKRQSGYTCLHSMFVSGRGVGAALCKPSCWRLDLWSGCKTTLGGGQWGSNWWVDGKKRWGGCMYSCIHTWGLVQNWAAGCEMTLEEGWWGSNRRFDSKKRWGGCMCSCICEWGKGWCSPLQTELPEFRFVVWVWNERSMGVQSRVDGIKRWSGCLCSWVCEVEGVGVNMKLSPQGLVFDLGVANLPAIGLESPTSGNQCDVGMTRQSW